MPKKIKIKTLANLRNTQKPKKHNNEHRDSPEDWEDVDSEAAAEEMAGEELNKEDDCDKGGSGDGIQRL